MDDCDVESSEMARKAFLSEATDTGTLCISDRSIRCIDDVLLPLTSLTSKETAVRVEQEDRAGLRRSGVEVWMLMESDRGREDASNEVRLIRIRCLCGEL